MSIHMSIHMSVCMSIHMSILRAHPRLLRMLARSLSSTARTMVHARARAVPAAYGRIGESVAGQMVVCTAGKEPKFEAEIDGTAAAALQAAPATTGSGSLPHVAMWGVCTHVALTHACTSACGAWVRRELKIDWRRLPPVCTRARARTHARTHTCTPGHAEARLLHTDIRTSMNLKLSELEQKASELEKDNADLRRRLQYTRAHVHAHARTRTLARAHVHARCREALDRENAQPTTSLHRTVEDAYVACC